MRYHIVFIGIVIYGIASFAGSAAARDGPDLSLSADAGLGGIAGRAHSTFVASVDLRQRHLSLGLLGRVRVALERDADSGYLRRRDWDEVSDYVNILRLLSFERSWEALSVRVEIGRLLDYSLGHGTLMRGYSNVVDPDHQHSGVRLEFNATRFALALMVDNYVSPSLISARLSAEPIGDQRRFNVALSTVIDPRAPMSLRTETHSTGVRPMIDDAYNLLSDDRMVGLVGIDTDYTFGGAGAWGTAKPYVDLNGAFQTGQGKKGGLGVHVGLSGQVPLTLASGGHLALTGQAEYSFSSSGYVPGYVQTFHDQSRYAASLNAANLAALSATELSAMISSRGGHGLLVKLGLDAGRAFRLQFGFSHEPRPDANRLWIKLSSRPIERLDFGVLVTARGIALSDPTSGIAALAEARVRITEYFYAISQFSRLWSVRPLTQHYGLIHSFNVGIGGNWSG